MKHTENPEPFHFKQFSMHHHRSTMKIGTDAMILAAWADVSKVHSILDVGSGSGIIALIMATRTSAMVDAVELDQSSALEAGQNFKASPFASRLSIYHNEFTTFAAGIKRKYDLIISNPPFFINDMRPDNSIRKQARHTDTLTFHKLCVNSKALLATGGKLCLVLPYRESKIFLEEAEKAKLYLNRKLLIFPKACKEPNRVNLELSHTRLIIIKEEKFIIRNEDNSFTNQYKNLLGEYYTSIK